MLGSRRERCHIAASNDWSTTPLVPATPQVVSRHRDGRGPHWVILPLGQPLQCGQSLSSNPRPVGGGRQGRTWTSRRVGSDSLMALSAPRSPFIRLRSQPYQCGSGVIAWPMPGQVTTDLDHHDDSTQADCRNVWLASSRRSSAVAARPVVAPLPHRKPPPQRGNCHDQHSARAVVGAAWFESGRGSCSQHATNHITRRHARQYRLRRDRPRACRVSCYRPRPR